MTKPSPSEQMRTPGQAEREPPLFVDLDGTLIRTDLLWEGLLSLARADPWACLQTPLWLLEGKAAFKRMVADRIDIDPELLPYNQAFLEFLREEAQRGRPIYLATASTQKLAEQIAAHLGIFRGVIASTDGRNLSGEEKLRAIRERCPGGEFDYAGNGLPDLEIWPHARLALLVNAPTAVRDRARQTSRVGQVFESSRPRMVDYFKAIRVHQWLKNLLLFVPLVTAHAWFSAATWINSALAFVTFCLVASGVYVLNDLLDLVADRAHPRKRSRAFAAGDISIGRGLALGGALLAAGIACGATLSPEFLAVLLGYVALTTAYSLWLKAYTLIDVLVLAALYTVRVIAGAVAIRVIPSFWLLAFSMFTFFSLALLKRYAELQSLKAANMHAARRRDYGFSDLGQLSSMGAASGYVATLVLALFVNAPEVSVRYGHPQMLWLLCPLFLYWISRLWLKAGRGEMLDDPVVFSIRDRGSRFVLAGVLVVMLIAMWI